MFADEPTGALDPRSARDVLRLLRKAADLTEQTVVLVTHDPVAAASADSVLFLSGGRIVDELPARSRPVAGHSRVPVAAAGPLRAVHGVRKVVVDVSFPVLAANGRAMTGHGWGSAALRPYELSDGRAPQRPDEVVLSRSAGLRVGATARLQIAGTPRPYRVTVLVPSGPAAAFFTDAAMALNGHPGRADALAVLADGRLDTDPLRAVGATPWQVRGRLVRETARARGPAAGHRRIPGPGHAPPARLAERPLKGAHTTWSAGTARTARTAAGPPRRAIPEAEPGGSSPGRPAPPLPSRSAKIPLACSVPERREMDDVEIRRHLPGNLPQLFADGADGADPGADGAAGRTLSVTLPEGDVVWPDPGYPQRQLLMRPAFWLSDEPVHGELWSRLRAEHAGSGLWPLLLDETDQPWAAGQIAPEPVPEIDNYSPDAFLYEVWADWAEQAADEDHEDLAPFGRHCPGPAPSGALLDDPDAVADRYARTLGLRGPSLGLVAVDRGADAVAAVGWQGALNHNEWTAPLAAVLRSWEDRFGARVIGLGFNTLELSVAAPPVSTRHAVHVAAEHWAFCPDILFQGPGTLAGYAEEIRGKTYWSFWWD